VSALRAKCPDCRTLTAVAIGPDYQCHACGREFAAGLIRVPRAWGDGAEPAAAAANMDLPWPEAATVAEETLEAQIETMRRELPQRPLVLGGCRYAHLGAVVELASRHGHVEVVWIDASGDRPLPSSPASGVYVAVDGGGKELAETSFDELEQLLGGVPQPLGAGFTGFVPSERTEAALTRLGHALGL
jgi:hypothetical protein